MRMKRLASLLGIALADPALVGLWQYPDRGVWIRIWPDALVFQCRTPAEGEPVASEGSLRGRVIFWDAVWPVQSASIEDGQLVIQDGAKNFRLRPAKSMQDPRCRALSPRQE